MKQQVVCGHNPQCATIGICDWWKCKCGNVTGDSGFYPCDATGKEIEPLIGNWDSLYVCGKCGAIIEQATGEKIGQQGA